MKHKIIHIVLSAAFCCCFSLYSYGQVQVQHPPEPMANDVGTNSVPGQDCAGEDTGSDPTVPPGLCLPINDYLIPLLIAGILLGAYQVHKDKVERV